MHIHYVDSYFHRIVVMNSSLSAQTCCQAIHVIMVRVIRINCKCTKINILVWKFPFFLEYLIHYVSLRQCNTWKWCLHNMLLFVFIYLQPLLATLNCRFRRQSSSQHLVKGYLMEMSLFTWQWRSCSVSLVYMIPHVPESYWWIVLPLIQGIFLYQYIFNV